MRALTLAVATLALALAGCSKGGSTGNNSSGAAAATQEQQPANLTDDPQNQMVPVAAASPSPVAGIPSAFQGRWGLIGTDCVRGHGEAKGALTISSDALVFHDSHATIAKADVPAPGSLSLKLAFTGEGKRWADTERLTLVDPQTLVREAKQPAGTFHYSRCPK